MRKQNKAKSIKTDWDLRVFYKSSSDPKIESDLKRVEDAYSAFEKKYREEDFTSSEEKLIGVLRDFEKMLAITATFNAGSYLNYLQHLDSSDHTAEAKLNKIYERWIKAANKITFFTLKIGKIKERDQRSYLASQKLRHFRYFLENIFKTAKYDLTEAEEKIMSLKFITSREMWVTGNEKLLSGQTVSWERKKIPVSEVTEIIGSLPTSKRRKLHDLLMETIKEVSSFAEAEINAVFTDKKINDELRGYANPYEAALLSDETDPAMVEALVKSVTDNFKISHSFSSLKAKFLGISRMQYPDRSAGIGKVEKNLPFSKGLAIVRRAFAKVDPEFTMTLDSFLENGQIDVFPKKGKVSGGYCSGNINAPTFILLNHISNMKSAMTLAHEMGHAFHFEAIKSQPILYQGVSTPVAEVASTFFEQIVFDDLFEGLSKSEQIVALHDKVDSEIKTVFRQIACFNFEKDLHASIRQKGFMPKEEIASLLVKHMKSYLGPVYSMKELDGYQFVSWSHIRNFFYVYSYAYGCLISKAMYRKYKQDKRYLDKIKTFLHAGNSLSPYQMFKNIGIDTSDPDFWKEGLKEIKADIKKLEKLSKESKLI